MEIEIFFYLNLSFIQNHDFYISLFNIHAY